MGGGRWEVGGGSGSGSSLLLRRGGGGGALLSLTLQGKGGSLSFHVRKRGGGHPFSPLHERESPPFLLRKGREAQSFNSISGIAIII